MTGAMNVLTPCLGICRINKHTQLCEGCHRTLTEVAEWLYYSDERKRAIMTQLPTRDPFPGGRRRRPNDPDGEP